MNMTTQAWVNSRTIKGKSILFHLQFIVLLAEQDLAPCFVFKAGCQRVTEPDLSPLLYKPNYFSVECCKYKSFMRSGKWEGVRGK